MGNPQYLDELITLSGKKREYLATKIGVSRQTFSKKCKEPASFTNIQVNILCDELNITKLSERQKIFC